MDARPGLPFGPARKSFEVSALRIAPGPAGLQRAAVREPDSGAQIDATMDYTGRSEGAPAPFL